MRPPSAIVATYGRYLTRPPPNDRLGPDKGSFSEFRRAREEGIMLLTMVLLGLLPVAFTLITVTVHVARKE